MSRRRERRDERQKLFSQMSWVFVYGPPLLLLLIAAGAAAVLAFVVQLPGTTFWGRWLLGVLLMLGLPALVYTVRSKLMK